MSLARHVALRSFFFFFCGQPLRLRNQAPTCLTRLHRYIAMAPSYVNHDADLDASAVVWQQHFGLNDLQPQDEDQWEEVLFILLITGCHSPLTAILVGAVGKTSCTSPIVACISRSSIFGELEALKGAVLGT